MLKALEEALKKEKRVLFAYLFGSFVKHPEMANDIDVAVYVKGRFSPFLERKLSTKLSKKLGKEVDVFVLNEKPLLFLSEVFRTGRLIFSRDERRRIKFETEKLREVLDFNKLMEYYDRMRCKRYEAG